MLRERAGHMQLQDLDYDFSYSKFGIAVLGAVLEQIRGDQYRTLANSFLLDELHLKHTQISDGSGDLGKLRTWNEDDA